MLLPSKTRPKRIDFTGSDGSRRRFLLKGGEDLQQEQRMQQLLACMNACMRTYFAEASANLPESGTPKEPKGADNNSKMAKSILTTFQDELQVNVLNVTPLGQSMGLVQWVPKSTTIYDIFSSWQARMRDRYAATAAAAAQKQAATAVASGANPNQHARGGSGSGGGGGTSNSAHAMPSDASAGEGVGSGSGGGRGRGKGRGARSRGGGRGDTRDGGGRGRGSSSSTAAAADDENIKGGAASKTGASSATVQDDTEKKASERALAQASKAILGLGKQEFPQLPDASVASTDPGISAANPLHQNSFAGANPKQKPGHPKASDLQGSDGAAPAKHQGQQVSAKAREGQLKGDVPQKDSAANIAVNIPNLPPEAALKPTELFYSVLQQELRAARLAPQLPRSEWPPEVHCVP